MKHALTVASRWLLLLSLLTLLAGSASATSVDLIWSASSGAGGIGGSSITASSSSSETLTLDIVLNAGPEGVCCLGYSIAFDMDLGDELDLVSVAELDGGGFFFQLTPGPQATQESSFGGVQGEVLSMEAVTLGNGPVGESVLIGQLVFTTNPDRLTADGADVSLFVRPGLDGFFDNAGEELRPEFGTASVDPMRTGPPQPAVPEPSAALLFAGGFAIFGGHCARRRRKR